jgi:methyl-accepting chemotaxis protein
VSAPRRLRRKTVGRRPASGAASPLEEAGLWSAQEQAKRAVEQSGALAERVAASVARQRGLIERSAEQASVMAARAEGVAVSAARVSESFDRLGVVALNAGLEGARVAEPQGRALLLLSEEVRANVTRGAEASRKLAELVEEIAGEAAEVRRQLERSRAEVAEVGQDAAQLRAATQDADRALGELGQRLRRATGIDPEVARAVAVAAEHAQGLVTALSTLSTVRGAGASVMQALQPVMAPLGRLLEEIDALEDDDVKGPRSRGEGP